MKTIHKFNGSWGWFIFWLILLMPVGIVYFFINWKEVKGRHGQD